MLLKVNTDNHVDGSTDLAHRVERVVEEALGPFGERVTRVEVYLTDESSATKSSDSDKRCVMEARLAGLQPISVSHNGASLQQAIDGAAEKIKHALDRTVERLDRPKGRTPYGGDITE